MFGANEHDLYVHNMRTRNYQGSEPNWTSPIMRRFNAPIENTAVFIGLRFSTQPRRGYISILNIKSTGYGIATLVTTSGGWQRKTIDGERGKLQTRIDLHVAENHKGVIVP